MDAFRTMIVPSAYVELARTIASTLVPGGVGMWTTELSTDGQKPASHYVSTGYIPAGMAAVMPLQVWSLNESGNWVEEASVPGDLAKVYQLCQEAGVSVTEAQIKTLFDEADVTEQEPFMAFGRIGLMLITGDING